MFMSDPFFLSGADWMDSTNSDLYELYSLAVERQQRLESSTGSSGTPSASSGKVWKPESDAENVLLMQMLGVQGIPEELLNKSPMRTK